MHGVAVGVKILFLICGLLHLTTPAESAVDNLTDHYCRICRNHTMCRFPYDDPGQNCEDVENGDLDVEDIRWILRWHNTIRNDISEDLKHRDTWSSSYNMMQLSWNLELAKIARKWVLQCNMYEKDECRNLENFLVIQNVNALDLEEVGNITTFKRLEFHMRTWYKPIKFSQTTSNNRMGANLLKGLATPSLAQMGCGRATYTVDVDDGKRFSRVEALVCNYGPITKVPMHKKPSEDFPCQVQSREYPALCMKLQRREAAAEDRLPFRMLGREAEPRQWLHAPNAASGTSPASSSLSLLLLLLVLLMCCTFLRC